MAQEEELPPAVKVPLNVRSDVNMPAFANLVLFNDIRGPGIGDQVILTFFHVFMGNPTEPSSEAAKEVAPIGEAVAKVSLSRDTAKALRNLLMRKMPPSPGELEEIESTKGDDTTN